MPGGTFSVGNLWTHCQLCSHALGSTGEGLKVGLWAFILWAPVAQTKHFVTLPELREPPRSSGSAWKPHAGFHAAGMDSVSVSFHLCYLPSLYPHLWSRFWQIENRHWDSGWQEESFLLSCFANFSAWWFKSSRFLRTQALLRFTAWL